MYSELDFTPEKSFSSNYKNSQLLLTAAAALSQNSPDSSIAKAFKALNIAKGTTDPRVEIILSK